jgi:tRNA(Arg) A34 adenosine deaminase TadA
MRYNSQRLSGAGARSYVAPRPGGGMTTNPFMSRAIALSLENVRSGGGPFGAVVVKDGQIIAEGTNRVTAANDPTAHAEIVAIREGCRVVGSFQLTGCEIYTSCEPCPMCVGAIYWARPAKVYFANTAEDAAAIGFDDSLIASELRLPGNQRRIPFLSLMREEAQEAFREWERKKDKIPY